MLVSNHHKASHQTRAVLLMAVLTLLLPVCVYAQIGNDNPTGPSGLFNGNVTSGGSYDPYTGNATRSVTDLVVAGGVGAYPLAFTRTMNSRYTPGAGTLEFGQAGTWRHSYQWSIDPISFQNSGPNRWYVMPTNYSVNYPDGRRVFFNAGNRGSDPNFHGPPGVSDRFQQLQNDQNPDVYLLLSDGGKVWFHVNIIRDGDDFGPVTSTFEFEFLGIIDPYGQVTTVSYPDASRMVITEPAGRSLTLFYITTPWNGDTVIDRVVASDGRSVKYNYGGYQPAGLTTYTYLGNVQYLDNNGAVYATAIYAYQPGNVDPDGRPLIQWCIDPMYGGPMWAIGYTFVPGGVYGQLQSENYLDPRTGAMGGPVSSLSISGDSRTETRGDGPSRTFNYSGGKIVSYTDFKGQLSYISYDGNGYTSGFTDARGNTTTTSREGTIGALSVLTHPDQSTQQYAYWYANGAPYHVQIRGDERGHNTYFTRDGNFRLTRVDYPDYPNGAYETFTYDGFGHVLAHRMTSGGIENFTYYDNGRGPMYSSSNPDGTTYYYYDGNDRLEHVTDARWNSTWFQYNARGQVTRVTHQGGSFVQAGYNDDGTLAWTADENHPNAATDPNQRTRYSYDDYKRVTAVTNPLNQTTSYYYGRNWSDPLVHTTSNLKAVYSPMGKTIHSNYDENWQRILTREPSAEIDA